MVSYVDFDDSLSGILLSDRPIDVLPTVVEVTSAVPTLLSLILQTLTCTVQPQLQSCGSHLWLSSYPTAHAMHQTARELAIDSVMGVGQLVKAVTLLKQAAGA